MEERTFDLDEYNKMCTEFLNWELKNGYYNPDMTHDFSFTRETELKFNSNWDWIFEIIEKIECMGYLVVIQSNFCQIQETGKKENGFKPYIFSQEYGIDKKEAVILSIFIFLKNDKIKKTFRIKDC